MRLGYKSKLLLESLVSAGADALDVCAYPKSILMNLGGWNEEKYASRQLKRMQEAGWIVWDDSRETGEWVLKLTQAGVNEISSDLDPELLWDRKWDGNWRIVGFDLPAHRRDLRRRLVDWLHVNRFGCLQGSLWVTPCLDDNWEAGLKGMKINPSAVSFFEGHSFAWSKDTKLVTKAWNFKEINRLYRELLNLRSSTRSDSLKRELGSWIQNENAILKEVMAKDPFLPRELLPKGYLGIKALSKRGDFFASLLRNQT